jgi:broad specificity phosphatase PhoE
MTETREVILVRHASTDWSGRRYCGRSDPPLNEAGRAVATELARRLAPTLDPATRIVASPARRAIETAQAIATAAGGVTVERDPRWRETDFGLAEGLSFDELAVVQPAVAEALLAGSTTIDWPAGETAAALAARVASAWGDLLEAGRPAVVVTHAGPILHALGLARNGVAASFDEVPPPGREIRVIVPARTARPPAVLPSRA